MRCAGLLVVWCFCVSSYVFGLSTVEKRDVLSNDTVNGVNDTRRSGSVDGIDEYRDESWPGLLPGIEFGNYSTSEEGSEPLNGTVSGVKNSTVDGLGSGYNLTADLGSFGDLDGDSIKKTGTGSNLTHDVGSGSNFTDEKYKDEGWKKNSTQTYYNKDTKSNSTGFQLPNGTSHLKDDTTGKNATSNSTYGNLLGGLFGRGEKNSSQKVPSSSGLDTDDSFNWPNDQGSHKTDFKNITKTPSTASADNWLDNTSHKRNKTSSQPKPPSNHISNEKGSTSKCNATSHSNGSSQYPCNHPSHQEEVPPTNINSTQSPLVITTPLPDPATKYTTAYWLPIFNFDDDFYFLTKKGYAKLVDFPPPVIYSFKSVPLQRPATVGQPRQQSEHFSSSFFDAGSLNFADCYVDSNMGAVIPNSYFGNWVAVFNLESGWNLETYEGYVPLDLYGEEAPVTYEFLPVMYELPAATSSAGEAVISITTDGFDDGLATWSEPLVVED